MAGHAFDALRGWVVGRGAVRRQRYASKGTLDVVSGISPAVGYTTEAEFPNVVQSWSDRLHPDDAPATFAAFGATCASGVGYDVTYRLKVRDGSSLVPRDGRGCAGRQPPARRACGSLVDIDAATRTERERKETLDKVAHGFEQRIGVLVAALSGSSKTLEETARGMSGSAASANHQTGAMTKAATLVTATSEKRCDGGESVLLGDCDWP